MKKKIKENKITVIILGILLIVLAILLIIKNQSEYKGYWCKYVEEATIIVHVKKDCPKKDRDNILAAIDKMDNVVGVNEFDADQYADENNITIDVNTLYDAYIVKFNSADAIGTYIETLSKIKGVVEAKQFNVKNNILLYNIKGWNKYTLANSDEATDSDLIKGKYKEKDGVITFKPDNKDAKQTLLYYKNGLLCEEATCNTIFFRSNESCEPLENE